MSIIQQQPASNAGDKHYWGELRAAGRALAVAEAALTFSGLTMLITETARQAAEQTRALAFFSAAQQLPIYSFPDWETLPYDIFSPHQDIISARLQTLANLPHAQQGIIVVPLATLMHRIAPTDFVASRSFSYNVGQTLDRIQLQDQLTRAGYQRVDTVFEHGEYAFRGSIIDLYPMGEQNPFRIDLLDDEIESLRLFDPESQRSQEKVDQLLLLPAKEFATDSEATNRFLNNWHDHFDHNPNQCSVYKDVKDGIAPQGIEYYLPLFFEQTATLFDYLPKDIQLFTHAGIEEAATAFWQDVNSRYEEYGVDPERPILPPAELFIPTENLFHHIKQLPRTIIGHQPVEEQQGRCNMRLQAVPDVTVNAKLANPLTNLQAFIKQAPADMRLLFCAESAGRREVLIDLLKTIDIRPAEVDYWHQFIASDAD
ncbi:MAG: transcription-repair coupling factor, partial [Porticoccaceae bacterium]